MSAWSWLKPRAAYKASVLFCAALLFSSQPAPAQFGQQGSKLVGGGAVGKALQGRSVALAADGNTAIVGGIGDDGSAGAVWVFTRSGDVWTQQGPKLTGTGAVGPANQGTSVALSADGNTAIVGGYSDNGAVGAAWVFTRSGGVWTQQGPKLVGTGAVGASEQGWSVALSDDGDTAIVGGFGDNVGTGAAWVFTRSGGVWTQQGPKLVGTGAVGTGQQGISVALSADGNTAVVGGPVDNGNLGAAWVFTRSGGMWTQQGPKLVGTGAAGGSGQGWSVALSADGNSAVVGGPNDNANAGAVWVFTRSGGVWTQQGAKLVGSGAVGNAVQGTSLALSADGDTAIVGGPFDSGGSPGATWVFTRSDGVWTQREAKLVGSGAVGGVINQGISTALSADGSTAIVGGHVDNGLVGAAWVFVRLPPAACTLASQFGDFNGDGRSDLMFRRQGDGMLSQYLMNGFQVVSVGLLGPVGLEWTIAAVADFNGDGTADLLFRRQGDGMLSLYLMSGANVLSAQLLGIVGLEWEIIGAADFNGDGRADILFRRASDGMLSLYLMNGFQVVSAQLIGAVGPDWRVRAVRDFNADGRADILFRRAGDGMLSLYLFNGFQLLDARFLGVVGSEWTLLGARDFNGDGTADLVFRRTDGMLSLYLMSGFQILQAQLIGVVGLEWTLLGLGDLNGDGRSDMVFRRASDGMLSAYLFSGFQLLAAELLGPIGVDWSACYGQPPLVHASR